MSPHSASPLNASFGIHFIGDAEILSSNYSKKSVESENNYFYLPITEILPGETRQFIVPIMPLNETPLNVWVVVSNEHGNFVMQSDDEILVSIGNRSSDYQLDEDSYTKNPFTKYVWTEIPYPDCWWSPWSRNGQSVYDYYADRGIEIHDAIDRETGGCEGCMCISGSILFLTPEHDREDVLSINYWEPYGVDPPF